MAQFIVISIALGVIAFSIPSNADLFSNTTTYQSVSEYGKGYGLRSEYEQAVKLINNGDFDSASAFIESTLKKFEQLFNRKIFQYSFDSAEEVAEYRSKNNNKFEWIDSSYKGVLQLKAFLLNEKKQFNDSLSVIEKIEKIAPISASVRLEKGYSLNRLKRPNEAMQVYQRAIDLSLNYKSQKPFHAAALRGLGSSLIELGRLDEAESIFKQSLAIEPNSKVALTELKYINKIKEKH